MGLDGRAAHLRLRARQPGPPGCRRRRRTRCWYVPSSPSGPRCSRAHLRDASSPAPVESLLRHFGGGWVPLPLDERSPGRAARRADSRHRHRRGARRERAGRARSARGRRSHARHLARRRRRAARRLPARFAAAGRRSDAVTDRAGSRDPPAQTELLRNAKRAAHTLKGSANILGIRGVAKLAHRLEDMLEICEAEAQRTFRACARRR